MSIFEAYKDLFRRVAAAMVSLCIYIHVYVLYIYTSSIYIPICTLTLVRRIAIPILTNGNLYGGVK